MESVTKRYRLSPSMEGLSPTLGGVGGSDSPKDIWSCAPELDPPKVRPPGAGPGSTVYQSCSSLTWVTSLGRAAEGPDGCSGAGQYNSSGQLQRSGVPLGGRDGPEDGDGGGCGSHRGQPALGRLGGCRHLLHTGAGRRSTGEWKTCTISLYTREAGRARFSCIRLAHWVSTLIRQVIVSHSEEHPALCSYLHGAKRQVCFL